MNCRPTTIWITLALTAALPATSAPVEAPVAGFTINAQDRLDVVAGFHRYYLSSEGAAAVMGWTGNYDNCIAGTTSQAFRDMTRRRVNYFRAMAGLPANITFDAFPAFNAPGDAIVVAPGTLKSTCAQHAALIQTVANEGYPPDPSPIMSHNPPNNWYCWTAAGWNGSHNGNLALSYAGPDAINAYMDEADGTDPGLNADVGHRRYILYSRAQDMATGDTPGDDFRYASNCLYVFGNEAPAPPPQFVAWPPAGYCPYMLAFTRWSLSYPGANFSNATVTMTNAVGTGIPVTLRSRTRTDVGDNTISWDPAAAQIVVPTAGNPGDKTYNVTVSGILIGGQATSRSYQVHLIDPNSLGVSPAISGTLTPPQNGASYTVVPVPTADANDVLVAAKLAGTTFSDGAENPAAYAAPNTNTQTMGPVAAFVAFAPRTGTKAYHLTLTSANYEAQTISLNASFVPSANSSLNFYIQSRFMAAGTKFALQATTNDGTSWTDVWAQTAAAAVLSSASPAFNATWQARSVSLGAYAGKIVRLRLYYSRSNEYVDGTNQNAGAFLDDLTVSNCQLLGAPVRTAVNAGAPAFALTTAMAPGGTLTPGTQYVLSYQPVMGASRFDFAPALTVTPTSLTGYDGWVAGFYPSLGNSLPTGDDDGDGIANLVEFAFNLDPTKKDAPSVLPQPTVTGASMSWSLTAPAGITGVTYGVQFSTNLAQWEDLTASLAGSTYTFTKSTSGLPCGYMRIKIARSN